MLRCPRCLGANPLTGAFPAPEELHELWLAAAVSSGWPVLRCVADEGRVEAVLADAEAVLGPLPQAVIDEPSDEGAPWALEIELPGLALEKALVLAEIDPVWFTPGPRPELAQALERGTRIDELDVVGPLVARRPIGLDGGKLPELGRSKTADVEVIAFEAELADELRRIDPALVSWSGRGAGTVAPVVDPETGRFGVLLSLPSETFAVLDGVELQARRRAILEMVAELVRRRATHERFRLAPDVLWWTPLDGMDVAIWLVAPALPVWAPEIDAGIAPGSSERQALARSGDPLRLVVVPASAAGFEEVCEAGTLVAESQGAGGSPGEWVLHRGRWSFSPSWSIDEPSRLEEVVEAFAALGPVLVFADPSMPDDKVAPPANSPP